MQVIAHRGASSYAPENTIPAFDLALDMGADGLETDIRATADGVLVLLHDSDVDRTTDGQGAIAELSWDVVQGLDAGIRFDSKHAGTRIITLPRFLERYGHRTLLALEIKAPGIEAQVVEALRGRRLDDRVTITSFDWGTCRGVKRLDPALRVGWLTRAFDQDLVAKTQVAELAQICPPARDVTPELVAFAHNRGLEVRAWGVGDEELMVRSADGGVDGMTVNFPDKLLAYLESQGIW